ncbi:MAG: DUF5615 family PIN-like protein [Nanoarchaeota archaeon]
MKFLTDENVDIRVVQGLRKEGFDVKGIKELKMYSASDKKVLNLATKEKRILITYDKDFKNNPSFNNVKHFGIILLKLVNKTPNNILKIIVPILNSEKSEKLANNLTVISETDIVIYKNN